MDNNSSEAELLEQELINTISMFEQILEVMPNDELALRTLFDAYQKKGDRKQAFEMLQRLALLVEEENNAEAARNLLEQLAGFAEFFNDAMRERIESLKSFVEKGEEAVISEKSDTTNDINSELALAWTLFQDGQLTQEDYSNVVHDLTEISTKKSSAPITVLHVLHYRSFKHITQIITYLITKTSTPYLSLANFEIPESLYKLLPLDFISQHAAIPFRVLSTDLLLAILNPMDLKLKEEVEKRTGKRCHTYLVAPEEYDELLGKIRKYCEKTM